jgi:vitamin B12 transporter
MMLRIFLFLYLTLFSTVVLTKEIPVIVISAGKTVQSYSSVGSQITIINSETIENSLDSFLTDLLGDEAQGLNIFQLGGKGTNAGIQLRGLPKRYSTVYIDGVKMNDPSASDNGFYSQGLFKDSIDRIEILKGSQSSLYGNGAVGGTINIFTKKGKLGNHQNATLRTGQNNTQDIFYSFDGADEKQNYYVGLNYYSTDGISAMNNDNDEDDPYENISLTANYGYEISGNNTIENSLRVTDSFLKYDSPSNSQDDLKPQTDDIEAHYSFKFKNINNNFKNIFGFSKSGTSREVTAASGRENDFVGSKDIYSYLGEYNFNLDSKVIYGTDVEFLRAKFDHERAGAKSKLTSGAEIYSQYVDYQFRPYENIYATIGGRNDKHTSAGDEQSYRATGSFDLGANSKIRSSYGIGFLFPSLYESAGYMYTRTTPDNMNAERTSSFDIGYETYFDTLDLGFNITYFNIEIEDPLMSSNVDYIQQNYAGGKNTSEGIELATNWTDNKKLDISFNYTYTKSYSGMDCDKPLKDAFGLTSCLDTDNGHIDYAMVRVPLHAFSSKIDYEINKRLSSSLLFTYKGRTRDYGTVDQGYRDQILDEYFLIDLVSSYKLSEEYKLDFSLKNVLDKDYENANLYTGTPRTMNIVLKKSF